MVREFYREKTSAIKARDRRIASEQVYPSIMAYLYILFSVPSEKKWLKPFLTSV